MSGFRTTPMGEVFSMDRFAKAQGDASGSPVSDVFQQGKDLLMGKTPTPDEILAARAKAGTAAEAKILATNPTATKTAIDSAKYLAGEAAEKALQPSFLRKYGPITALTALGTGFFDKPKVKGLDDFEDGQDLIDKNREKYIVENLELQSAEPPYEIPTMYPGLPGIPGIMRAEEGGPAFPRRTGEFVMTTDAVNGAGDGDNEKGIKNMYAMMRSFEAKARA